MYQGKTKHKLEVIEKLYQEYLLKIDESKKERNEIINEFVAELEKEKMEEIRNKLSDK